MKKERKEGEGIEDEERTSEKMRVNCRRGGEKEGGVAKVNNLTGFEREREKDRISEKVIVEKYRKRENRII